MNTAIGTISADPVVIDVRTQAGAEDAFELELFPGTDCVVSLETRVDAAQPWAFFEQDISTPWSALFARNVLQAPPPTQLRISRTSAAGSATYKVSPARCDALAPYMAWVAPAIVKVGDIVSAKLYPEGAEADLDILADDVPIAGTVRGSKREYTIQQGDRGKVMRPHVTNIGFTGAATRVTDDEQSPRRFSVSCDEASPNVIVIVYDETLKVGTAAYQLGGTLSQPNSIASVAVAANEVRITCAQPFVMGDAPLLSAGAGAVVDFVGNPAPAIVAVAVFMQFPVPLIRMAGNAYTEVNGGWYPAVNGGQYMNSALSLPDSTRFCRLLGNGWMAMQCMDASTVMRAIGLQYAAGNHLAEVWYQARLAAGQVRAYVKNKAVGVSYTFPTPGPNCLARLLRTGATMQMDTSEDGGASWAMRHVFVELLPDEAQPGPCIYSDHTTVPIVGVRARHFSFV